MKTIDFIKQFHANPHAYASSKIPLSIRSWLHCKSNQRKIEEKKIIINIPSTIDDTRAFPEWEKIQQYYKYNNKYKCFILSNYFVIKMKVEYIVKKITISPEPIRQAINEMIDLKTEHIKFRIENTQAQLKNMKRKLNNYQKIMQVFQVCKQ